MGDGRVAYIRGPEASGIVNVTIDARALVGNRTGIGVHTAEIARRLGVDPPPLLASHAEIADKSGLEGCRFRVDAMPFGVLWQQLVLARLGGDVVWGPHGTLPLAARTPGVVTLHDFTSLTAPGRHKLKTIASFNLFIGRSLEKAARVAAVSRATADEAMRWFGVPASKIALVPNGVDEFFSPGGEEEDYILFAGTLEPRKGIDDLVAVYESLPAPRPRLVLCGDRGWGSLRPSPGLRPPSPRTRGEGPLAAAAAKGPSPREAGRGWREAPGEGLEITGYVSREQLRDLYRRAKLFVYPSRAEGFGIPPLEAMACGAPVLATRVGAIPEFAGDAALLVDPGDRDALREAIARLLRDPALRRELRARGPERAKRYRWETSAATMTRLLEDAAR
jgi:glycosyltransferase involved in cell wall biosynthesis